MVFVVLVDSDSFHGSSLTNPYQFKHHDITEWAVQVDGQCFPSRPYRMDFPRKMSLEAFDGFLTVTGRRFAGLGSLMFDRTGFGQGYTILAANLAPSGTGRDTLGLIKEGNLSLSLSFAKPLPNTVMVVGLLLFDTLLEINHFRQLITDFTG